MISNFEKALIDVSENIIHITFDCTRNVVKFCKTSPCIQKVKNTVVDIFKEIRIVAEEAFCHKKENHRDENKCQYENYCNDNCDKRQYT